MHLTPITECLGYISIIQHPSGERNTFGWIADYMNYAGFCERKSKSGKDGAKIFATLPSFHAPNPLLAYQHPSSGSEIACRERVEVDTACDGFT